MKSYSISIGVLGARHCDVAYETIARRFGIGVGTVYRIEKMFNASGKSLEEFRNLEPTEAQGIIYPDELQRRKKVPLPDFAPIHRRIAESDGKWNLMAEWFDYIKENPDGYKLTQFYEHYNRFVEVNFGTASVKMAVERKPGEKMYIDWAGDTPSVIEDGDGKKKVHLFVTTVGFSSKVYAEAFTNETLDKFIRGVVDALQYYGGTTRYWIPDNLKTAVTKHDRDHLVLNSVFHDLESFYDVVVIPPPARKPKGKPTVESAVRYAETYILEKLKRKTYRSISEVNDDVAAIVSEMNERTEKRAFSREQLFQEYDLPCMKPLNGRFSPCDYKFFSRVPDNYHLEYDGHYYSVSYMHHGKPAILRATFMEVVVLDENNRIIASHRRSYEKFPLYITRDEHMPKEHRFYKEVNEHNGSFYRSWARKFGASMGQFIDLLLKKADHEEQAYNSCNGILHTAESYPFTRVEETARFCLDHGLVTYTGFTRALKRSSDSPSSTKGMIPVHENIRGPEAFR